MGSSPFTMRSILTLFLLVAQLATALKFDLAATSGKNERCIRNFVSKDQLVVVTAIVSGSKGDGQRVNMHVRILIQITGPQEGVANTSQIKDSMGNDHGRPKDIVGEVRQAFTSTADTAFDVCMDNQLVGRSKIPPWSDPHLTQANNHRWHRQPHPRSRTRCRNRRRRP